MLLQFLSNSASSATASRFCEGNQGANGNAGTPDRCVAEGLSFVEGYNSLAIPIAAGVFSKWGLTLRPEIAAISMSGSSVLVALNALALKRLKLPRRDGERSWLQGPL